MKFHWKHQNLPIRGLGSRAIAKLTRGSHKALEPEPVIETSRSTNLRVKEHTSTKMTKKEQAKFKMDIKNLKKIKDRDAFFSSFQTLSASVESYGSLLELCHSVTPLIQKHFQIACNPDDHTILSLGLDSMHFMTEKGVPKLRDTCFHFALNMTLLYNVFPIALLSTVIRYRWQHLLHLFNVPVH